MPASGPVDDACRLSMAWKKVAKDTVALLSAEAGRHAYDRRLSDLIGELSTRTTNSCPMGRPGRPDPQHLRPVIHHPVIGDLDLSLESFPLAGRSQPEAPHLHRRAWSPSQYAPRLLARWAATTDGFEPAASTDTS